VAGGGVIVAEGVVRAANDVVVGAVGVPLP
jgi:hypothetical protein